MDNVTIASAVIIAGIVVGSLAMFSAIWVWARKQQFGYAGTFLSFFGTVLIGLSVFSKAQISVGDVEILVERLQQEVTTLEQENEAIARENEVISSEVIKLAQNLELQREGVLTLGRAITRAEPSAPTPVGNFMQRLRDAEVTDTQALEAVIENRARRTQPDTEGS